MSLCRWRLFFLLVFIALSDVGHVLLSILRIIESGVSLNACHFRVRIGAAMTMTPMCQNRPLRLNRDQRRRDDNSKSTRLTLFFGVLL